MNADKLLDAIGEIDDSLVLRARASHKTRKIWYICTAAACTAVVVLAGLRWLPRAAVPGVVTPSEPNATFTPTEASSATEPSGTSVGPTESRPLLGEITINPDLPALLVAAPFAGQGFESLDTWDITQENAGNPWRVEQTAGELPVYKNLAYTNRAGEPNYLTETEMDLLAQTVADAAGETAAREVETGQTTQPSQLRYTTQTMQITISGDGDILVRYSKPSLLPAEHRPTGNSTQQELDRTADWLLENFREILALADITQIAGAAYQEAAEGYFSVWQQGKTPEQTLLNYCGFAGACFTITPSGEISQIRLYRQQTAAELIGGYPTISLEEAKTMLLEGAYLSTVWEADLVGGAVAESIIGKVELVYRTGSIEETFLPYYRFWLEMSGSGMTWLKEGQKCYGAFYVPAVHPAYLTGLPKWDGGFN